MNLHGLWNRRFWRRERKPGWSMLEEELMRWGEADRTATFWWRDDDATHPVPELKTLIALRHRLGIPLLLSVIPAQATQDLSDYLDGLPSVQILQHGYAHKNYASPGLKASELGDERSLEHVCLELQEGFSRLKTLFPLTILPVVVPPWSQIAPAVMCALSGIGMRGVSSSGPRPRKDPCPGLVQVNIHLDLLDYSGSPRFMGLERAIGRLVGHLKARRLDKVDTVEPTGLLTHHRMQDREGWAFMEALGEVVMQHPSAKWVAPDWGLEDAGPAV